VNRNTKVRCKFKQVCKAPLCPKDEESLKWGVWLPAGEILSEVCRHPRMQNHPLVRAQHDALEKGVRTCLTAKQLLDESYTAKPEAVPLKVPLYPKQRREP